MPKLLVFLFYAFNYILPLVAAAQQIPASSLASQYSLSTSTVFPFPSATQASAAAQSFIVSSWSLGKGRIQDGPNNLAFVNDPYPGSTPTASSGQVSPSSPVLQVTYPAGSYSNDTGGAQLYTLWNSSDGSTFSSMLLSYEVAFEAGFDWVKGGKLPGLRGGLKSTGCSGGNKATGQDCFSFRVMWRPNGAGEVYAYIPSPDGLCSTKGIVCNSDFGISIQRGSFSFVSGQWNKITILVQLNNPPDEANGNILLYYNDLLALSQQNLQIRSNSSLTANGFYLSTFFGGSDSSWATPNTTHTFFRNIQMWGNGASSNLTGQPVKSDAHHHGGSMSTLTAVVMIATTLVALCV